MTKLRWVMFLLVIAAITVPVHGASIIVNHTNWDWYNSQNQTVFDRVGTQKAFFAHASVGGNIDDGLTVLHNSNATKYQLTVTSEDGTPPATTQTGRFYECNRGNPGWQAKVDGFDDYVQNGWCSSKVDFSMNKFCYIDQDAESAYYLNHMATLESGHSTTKFVYWTIPLTTDTSDNIDRYNFNQAVRNYAVSHDILLLDIADIEAWNLANVQQTFTNGGHTYQMLASDYSADGGHINSPGGQRVATAIYSLIGLATGSTPISYTISGTILHDGAGLEDVVMQGLPGNPVTNAAGFYSVEVNKDWTNTVTPTLTGYTFDPTHVDYPAVTEDQTDQDYTATHQSSVEAPGDGGGGGGCFINASTNGLPLGLLSFALLLLLTAIRYVKTSRKAISRSTGQF